MTQAVEDESKALISRYRDACADADAIGRRGNNAKIFGIVAGVVMLLVIGGASYSGWAFPLLFIPLAVAIGGMFYMAGLIAAAQAQVLLAALHTAVNSSPFLSVEQKGEVIHHSRPLGSL